MVPSLVALFQKHTLYSVERHNDYINATNQYYMHESELLAFFVPAAQNAFCQILRIVNASRECT